MRNAPCCGRRHDSALRTVPDLVFINCCHLGAVDSRLTLHSVDRSAFAATLAESLIRIGVRQVIAAGWAVDDGPAKEFATTFYREILAGAPFVDAVASAREVAWAAGGNTWAAYQCYGDPNWTLRPRSTAVARRDEYAAISSPTGLQMALLEIATQLDYMDGDRTVEAERIRLLEARFGLLWGGMGLVAEAFGLAYKSAGRVDDAISWFERALAAGDSTASIKSSEQLGNLRVRRASARAAAGKLDVDVIAQCRNEMQQAIGLLRALAELQPTVERCSLLGAAWKRLASLEALVQDSAAKQTALQEAVKQYRMAERMAMDSRLPYAYAPAINRMAIEFVANIGNRRWGGFDEDATAALRRSLQAQLRDAPDFWVLLCCIKVDLLQAVARGNIASVSVELTDRFADLNGRSSSRWLWASAGELARFILQPYLALAKGKERHAAQALVDVLDAYAS